MERLLKTIHIPIDGPPSQLLTTYKNIQHWNPSLLPDTVINMFLEIVTLVLSSASLALGKPMPRATPNLFLVGDSTMALHAASEGIQGLAY